MGHEHSTAALIDTRDSMRRVPTDSGSTRVTDDERSLLDVLTEDATLVMLVATVMAFAFIFKGAAMVGPDTWLGLVAGREIVRSGIPTEDSLTVLGMGEPWTDQQWLAHLAFYGLHQIGGVPLVALVSEALAAAAFALAVVAARARGASRASVLAVSIPALLLIGFSWAVRAQALTYVLFVATLWLLVSAAHRGPSKRTLLVLPMLAIWANLHGSAALGATLICALGVVSLIRPRGGSRRVALALAALPPFLMLVTPYQPTAILRYYAVLLLDPPFKEFVAEWEPIYDSSIARELPGAHVFTAVLLGTALGTVALLLADRKRTTVFEVIVLSVTFAGALMALRGIVWFGLAVLVIAPLHQDRPSESPEPAQAARTGRLVLVLAAAVLAISLGVGVTRASGTVARAWPAQAVHVVETATSSGTARPAVYGGLLHADWILWNLPELRGRVAFDARLELNTREDVRSMFSFESAVRREDVSRWARSYSIIVLNGDHPRVDRVIRELRSVHGFFVAHRSRTTVVMIADGAASAR